MSVQAETLIERSCLTIGEGPHWDERTQTLLYVDINDGSVHRWSAETGKDEKHTFGKIARFFPYQLNHSNTEI